MSESVSSGMTIDIRPMIEDVSQVMTKHITSILSGVIGEYTIYKETHDTIMGLPCVRRLQERIIELESNSLSSINTSTGTGSGSGSASGSGSGASREDEIAQLQSAITDLNRYIHALESKVDVKSAMVGSNLEKVNPNKEEEIESVRLEIKETNSLEEVENNVSFREEDIVIPNTHKNVIISSDALDSEVEEESEEEDPEAIADAEMKAEALLDAQDNVENIVTEVDAEEEDAEEEDAEEEDAEEEDAEEEDAEEEDAEEEEPKEEEPKEEDAEEEDAEEEEPKEEEPKEEDAEEEAEEEDAEIEVSEVTIKGKTYFTTDPVNGIIYACVDDDVGDEVGAFKNGVAVFNKMNKK